MKIILALFMIPLILIGCGGGGGGESSSGFSGFPSEVFSGTSYDTWDYIVPQTSQNTTQSISAENVEGYSYDATFKTIEENSVVEEQPSDATNEKIRYVKKDNKINITFYKDDKAVYQYDMKRYVKIGEQTISDSSCMLVKHYEFYPTDNPKYNDVIEIDCGPHKGYYAKGKGQIDQK